MVSLSPKRKLIATTADDDFAVSETLRLSEAVRLNEALRLSEALHLSEYERWER